MDAGRRLYLRVERQTLTRLPETRSVLFTILTFVLPLAMVAADRVLARLLAARLGELPDLVLAYKNLAANQRAIIDYLGTG
jgi:hypothetical protein